MDKSNNQKTETSTKRTSDMQQEKPCQKTQSTVELWNKILSKGNQKRSSSKGMEKINVKMS